MHPTTRVFYRPRRRRAGAARDAPWQPLAPAAAPSRRRLGKPRRRPVPSSELRLKMFIGGPGYYVPITTTSAENSSGAVTRPAPRACSCTRAARTTPHSRSRGACCGEIASVSGTPGMLHKSFLGERGRAAPRAWRATPPRYRDTSTPPRHRQASRRWRGGRRGDSARTRPRARAPQGGTRTGHRRGALPRRTTEARHAPCRHARSVIITYLLTFTAVHWLRKRPTHITPAAERPKLEVEATSAAAKDRRPRSFGTREACQAERRYVAPDPRPGRDAGRSQGRATSKTCTSSRTPHDVPARHFPAPPARRGARAAGVAGRCTSDE